MGLITLEDILEEIVGEFTTQSPLRPPAGFVRQDDGSVIVEGSTTAARAQPQARRPFPLDGPKTLNGLILEHLEDIPEPGTTVKIAGYPIEIVQTQDRAVKICPHLSEDLKLIKRVRGLPRAAGRRGHHCFKSVSSVSRRKWLLHQRKTSFRASGGRWSRRACLPEREAQRCRTRPTSRA